MTLDGVIADTAASNFCRSTHGLDENEKAARVLAALDSLHGSIRRLETPAYAEELVALFYGVWYQPFQINAAYSLLRQAIEGRQSHLARQGRLEIVDFGGGALAMVVGLALAVSGRASSAPALREINVSIIEPSDAMIRTGFDIWERFMAACGYDVSLDKVSSFADAHLGRAAINLRRVHRPSDIEMQPDADRWLVAMHAYYGEQREAIKCDLSRIWEAFQPNLGLFTCHRDNLSGIDDVSPFAGPGNSMRISPLRLSGALPRVNRWRSELAHELGLQHDVRLTRPTEWDPERGLRDNRAILFQHG